MWSWHNRGCVWTRWPPRHRERTVVNFVMDAVAGARRTPGRHKTGGVPPKPPATILLSLWSSMFWDFGSLYRGVAASLALTVAAAAIRLELDAALSLRPAVVAAAIRVVPDVAAFLWPAVAVAANAAGATLRRHSVSAVAAQTSSIAGLHVSLGEARLWESEPAQSSDRAWGLVEWCDSFKAFAELRSCLNFAVDDTVYLRVEGLAMTVKAIATTASSYGY